MVKFYDTIPENLGNWALRQPLFFTASAPLTGSHVNVSPKGLPNSTFRILSPSSCAYLDSTGSGSETIAHIYENGRVTLMWCSFDTLPRILRFFCWGSVVEKGAPGWREALGRLGLDEGSVIPGARAVVELRVWKVSTSCGTGVPILLLPSTGGGGGGAGMTTAGGDGKAGSMITNARSAAGFREQSLEEEMQNDNTAGDGVTAIKTVAGEVLVDRKSMNNWCKFMEDKGRMDEWWKVQNHDSLDGLPALKFARRDNGERFLLVGDVRAWLTRVVVGQKESFLFGFIVAVLLMLIQRLAL